MYLNFHVFGPIVNFSQARQGKVDVVVFQNNLGHLHHILLIMGLLGGLWKYIPTIFDLMIK